MNKVINYLKSYLLFFIILFIYLLIVSLLFYLELISYKTLNIINFISINIMFYILGHKISSLEQNKGYLRGFISSIILVIIFLIITLITSKINFSNIVYYLSLIVSSIIGGIFGITKKS